MSFLGKFFRALSSEKYRKNPNGRMLTDEQYAALNVGAINAEQTMYFCDSLETGGVKNEMATDFNKYYGITDTESAVDILDWLKNRGHRVYFEAIKQFASGFSTAVDVTLLEEEERPRSYEFIQNINETMDDMIENGFINTKTDLNEVSVFSWDMGRLVLVSRGCYDLGYISEEKAWDYITEAYEKCRTMYSGWGELANGYIIGRCMWSGPSIMLAGLMDIAKELLEDEDSPWARYPLR